MHRCNIGDTLIQGEWGYISGRPHNFLAASTPSPIPCLPYLLTSVSLDACTHFERFLGIQKSFGIWKFIFSWIFERSIHNFSVISSHFFRAIPSRYFLCLRLNIDSCRVEYLSQSWFSGLFLYRYVYMYIYIFIAKVMGNFPFVSIADKTV